MARERRERIIQPGDETESSRLLTELAYERVTRRLGEVTGHVASGKSDWRCPAHDDSTASLSVTRSDRGVIVHCHAGCQIDDVLRALSLTKADLFDSAQNGDRPAKRELVDTYDYLDESGELLFQVVRFRDPDGKKAFQQRRPLPDGGYEWKLGDVRRVLYRLPKVIAAVQAGDVVFVVEGEKDVEAIERTGGVATCNAGGAGKWRKDYAEVLRGADVIVVPDQDPPGTKHAADVEASLSGVARSVRVLAPLAGKDAADHLAAGHSLEDWLSVKADNGDLDRSLVGELLRTGVPDPVMVHPWLYAGGLTTIQSEPGVGKTFVALWLCLAMMRSGYAVVYLDEEGGAELVAERLLAMGADPAMVDELFWYYPFPERSWSPVDVEALRRLLDSISAPIGAVVLDSLPDFLAAADMDEDRGREVTDFVRRLLGPARDVGAALLVLDHLAKPKEDGGAKRKRSKYSRGSGAKLAKAHLTMLLEAPEEFDRFRSGRLHLWATKDRRGFTRLPRLNQAPVVLEVNVEAGLGKLSIRQRVGGDGSEGGAATWTGPTQCMDAVLRFFMEHEEEVFSKSGVVNGLRAAGLGYRKETVMEAVDVLVESGELGAVAGRGYPRYQLVADGAVLDLTDDLTDDSTNQEEEF